MTFALLKDKTKHIALILYPSWFSKGYSRPFGLLSLSICCASVLFIWIHGYSQRGVLPVVEIDLRHGRSVGVEASTTTAVTATVATPGGEATRRAIATAHGRSAVATIGTAAAARTTATTTATVHARKVGALGDDLWIICQYCHFTCKSRSIM